MSARDELQKVIFGYFGPIETIKPYKTPEIQDRELADAILAAGYSKPRQVSTVAELDALPGSTVVKDALTQVFEKQEAGQWYDGPHDWLAFDGKFWDVDAIHLPATVLYTPDAPTETGTHA